MTESRSLLEWTTDDYRAVVDLAGSMSDYIEANEPDTLAFEWFGDEAIGEVVWYQVYRDDEAFLAHAENMNAAGFADEARRLLAQDRLLLLTPLTHPRTKDMARQVGAEEVESIAAVVR